MLSEPVPAAPGVRVSTAATAGTAGRRTRTARRWLTGGYGSWFVCGMCRERASSGSRSATARSCTTFLRLLTARCEQGFAEDANQVLYFYDGVKVGTIASAITGMPMYLVLENSLSGSYGGPSVIPATVQVSYVRVWQKS
jgi:hypothetical protein